MSTPKTGSATLVIANIRYLTEKDYQRIDFPFAGLSYFGIFPKIDVPTLTSDNVFVYWINNNGICEKVHFNVSILGTKREKLYTTEYSWQFDGTNIRPAAAFISRTKLLNPKNGYLVNEKLTLLCEAEIVDKEPKQLDSALQQELNNLSEDFQSLLIEGKFSNVILTVGTDEMKFNVHKAILSARSPVFAAMFEHDCEEKRQNEVKITDIDYETCEELLRFIYSGKVQSLESCALDLLQAADKYQLDSLKNNCENFLCTTLSVEIAANALFVADLHGATKLKDKCLEYISDNLNQVKDTDGWKVLDINAKLLRELLFYMANKNN